MIITEDTQFDIFVASRIGSFKHIKYHTDVSRNNKKCIENLVDIESLQKDEAITRLEWGDAEQTEILVGHKNQQIQVYKTGLGFTHAYTADFGTGAVVGLGRSGGALLAALADGAVRAWRPGAPAAQHTVQAGALDRMRLCADDDQLFATGGEENDLKVWRVGQPSPLFSAKNLPHDWLQLRRPVRVSDLTFLPGHGGSCVAVCSRHGYVRLYDTRAQRRPVADVPLGDMAATCIANSFHHQHVLVGCGRGQLQQVELRQRRLDRGFRGCAGAVADVAAVGAAGRRWVVSVALDRHLRVHRYDTKELVHQVYLTSKLTCALVQTRSSTSLAHGAPDPARQAADPPAGRGDDDRDEYDALFDRMETVGEKCSETTPAAAEPATGGVRPSPAGSTAALGGTDGTERAVRRLLRSTEKQKRRREREKRERRARSVYHTA